MDIFDKFFKKFAYKFDKGYPDMNNSQDVLLLESLISEVVGKDIILENQDLISLIKLNIKEAWFLCYLDIDSSKCEVKIENFQSTTLLERKNSKLILKKI